MSRWIDRLRPGLFPVLAMLFLWRIVMRPAAVIFPPRSELTDLLITHWPNAVLVRRALFVYRELPLWNPMNLAGQPFAADPLAGLWYPPNWVLVTPGVPLAALFNLLFLAHLAWGGCGMYRFCSSAPGASGQRKWTRASALIGAIAFMGMPKWIAHLGAGHVSLFFAVAWTPWLMMAVRRAASQGGFGNGAIAGATLAILFLADVRWAFYASALAGGYWMLTVARRPTHTTPSAAPGRLMAAVAFMLLFLSLIAVLALPFYQFRLLTARAGLTAADAAVFSLPPSYLAGLLLPDLGGFHEWLTYLGFLPLALAVYAVVDRSKDGPEIWFWAGAGLLAGVFSLGSYTPAFRLALRALPGLVWLRVPPRAWFVVGFAVCALAPGGAAALAADVTGRVRQGLALLAVGAGGLAWGLAIGAWVTVGHPLPNLFALAVSATIGLTLIALRARCRLTPAAFLALASLATAADLLWVDSTLIRVRPAAEVFDPGRATAEFLSGQPGMARCSLFNVHCFLGPQAFRVYSPSYSVPQHVGAEYGIEEADGVNPLQLASTVDFVSKASGVPAAGYSVTLPPLSGADPATSNSTAIPDTALLGLLNVRYVAAQFDLNGANLKPVARLGATRIYENAPARPRAWVVFTAEPVPNRIIALDYAMRGRTAIEAGEGLSGNDRIGAATVIRRGLNFLAVETVIDRPGMLVLAEVDYPGWRATVDGRSTQIVRVDGLLRGVFLRPGAHQIEFTFVPVTVIAGAAISTLGLIALGAIVGANRARRTFSTCPAPTRV